MADCPGALHFAQMYDGSMIRIRLPGGNVTRSQLKTLTELSLSHGNGLVDLTNRANLQIRGLQNISVPALHTKLASARLITKNLFADRLRNIMADPPIIPLSQIILDSTTLVNDLDQKLQQNNDLKSLSPKFSFIIDNGSPLHIANQPHDLALIACHSAKASAYRLSIAGQITSLIVSPNHAAQFLLTIAKLICTHPEPHIKRSAHLLTYLGIERLEQELVKYFPKIEHVHIAPQRQQKQMPPIGIIAQENGLYSLGLGVPVSRITQNHLKHLNSLYDDISANSQAQVGSQPSLYLSPWQTLYFTNIPEHKTKKALLAGQQAGFITDQSFQHCQVYACSGASGCIRTAAHCKEDGADLLHKLQNTSLKEPIKIHISGCHRGCANGNITDYLAVSTNQGYALYRNQGLAALRSKKPPAPDGYFQNLTEAFKQLV